jgi:hypothetical protein
VTISDVQAPVRIWKAEGSEWIWWCAASTMCMFQVSGAGSQADALNQALEHLTTTHSEPTA